MTDAARPATDETPVPPLRWPPPGLARIQGDLWIVARKMAVAAAVLVLPLLVTLTFPQSDYGLGPLGEAWWITLLTTILGIAIFTDAVVSLVRFLRRVQRALREGYSRTVVGMVVSDRDRDNGFLLQGVGPFTPLEEQERKTVARLRLLIPLLYLVAATWFVVGFGVLILLAARGLVSVTTVGFGTVAPAAVIGFAGLVLRGTEGTLAYRSRESWHPEEWSQDLARHEIEAWGAAVEERGLARFRERTSGAPAWTHVALVGVVVGAFIAAVPTMTFVPAASLGAIFTSIGGPRFTRTLQRTAEVEAYRVHRLPSGSALSPQEAGEVVQVIAFVGREGPSAEELRDPVRSYEEPWIPEGAPEGFHPESPSFWTDTIWNRVERGLSPEELGYLRRVAAHPASDEFSGLARVGSIDLIHGFYRLPFDVDETFLSLPFVRLTGLRDAASVHLARGALSAAEGRYEDAEESIREVLSVGLLLVDESPLLMVNLVGAVLVRQGGEALSRLLALRGEDARAEAVAAAARATEAAAEKMTVGRLERTGGDDLLELLPELAEDPRALRGLRWDVVHMVTVFSPCANLRRVVFGPDGEYLTWLGSVRRDLARYPSEEAYFEVVTRGLAPAAAPGLVSRLLSVPMGGLARQGSCARILAVLPEL